MVDLITDYLDDIVKEYPYKTAIKDSFVSTSFVELRDISLSVASYLIDNEIFNKAVCIFLDQSCYSVVSMLGISYSGNHYTVLDIKSPLSRTKRIIDNLEPAFIITDSKGEALLQELSDIRTKVVLFDDIIKTDVDLNKITEIRKKRSNKDLLYILYTSGSTGTPKGVQIGQRSVIEYTEWVTETFCINENSIIGNQAPFYFDNSVLDIYQMLKTGATLHIIPRQLFSFPVKLLGYVSEHKIDTVFWVPTVLCFIARFKALDLCDVSCLKRILFAGEVMPVKQLNYWREHLPNALFANLYGPTEITVDCTYYIVQRDFQEDESLPIGFECRKDTVLLLHDNKEVITLPNVQGELCVKGPSLSYGYFNDPDKTDKAFVYIDYKGQSVRIYRTGDLVHYNQLGELIYDGRKDSQIKFYGHRIELGEIENQTGAISGVDRVCCTFSTEKQVIGLFYTGEIKKNDLLECLKNKVPDYMLPKECIKLSTIPLNSNGKIDRPKLKEQLEIKLRNKS